ncbi:alpha/beta hydrolase fold domain-containing protein [Ferruginibacter profundus]
MTGRNYHSAKILVALTGIWGFAATATAQMLTGLTGRPDTSFSVYSAYINAKKQYPGISIAGKEKLPSVTNKANITYSKVGKRSLKTDVFYPKQNAAALRTAIIIIHGGGWRSGSRTQHQPLAQQLAALGYVCFTPEYRLSTEALFPAAIYDLKAAIRWVRDHADKYQIDTAKIVVAGFSAGGELAAFLATTGNMPLFEGGNGPVKTPSHVNALVDIDGTLSFVHAESSERSDTGKSIGASTYWMGYTQKENFTLWQAASPLSYAGANTPPTLFLNSAVARMHAGRDEYVKILQQYHIYTEVQTFENSPHAFCLFNPWFIPTVNYIDAFLKKVFNPNRER